MENLEEIESVYASDAPPADPVQAYAKPQPAPRRLAPVRAAPRQGWSDEPSLSSPPATSQQHQTVVEVENIPTVPSVSAPPLDGPAASFEGLLSPPAESSSGGERTPVGDMEGATRPRSPSASSQSSKSSKRTSISAETSVNIRQRIRQQARSMLEKKRGSVQLQKRLLRSQTVQGSVDLKDQDDYEDLDRQIEQTVELGSKYVSKEHSQIPPEHIQRQFFEGIDEERTRTVTAQGPTGNGLVFTKPRACTSHKDTFRQQLTTYNKKRLVDVSVEDPMLRMNSQLFAARPGRDYSLLIQRTGTTFLTSDGRLRGLEPMITDKPLRLDREDDEDFGLVQYRGAENWDEWESHAKYPHKYFQLNIDVNHVEFDHHWLFSAEDSLAREVKNLFDDHVEIGEGVLKLVQNFMTAQQDEQMRRRSEEEHDDNVNDGLTEKRRELAEAQRNYQHIGQLLEDAWLKLQEMRRTSGIRSTGAVLDKVESLANMEVPDELREFFNTASYTLRDEPIEASAIMNKTDNERIAAISKCRIQVHVYFNDIFVCKTEEVPLSRNFVAKFAHVYSLRIYEKPEVITLVVRERFGRTAWKELARIFVPLPIGDEENEAENEATPKHRGLDIIEFASDIVQNKYKGSIGCGQVDVSRNLHGKLYCKAKWVDNGMHFRSEEEKRLIRDTEMFSLIPRETRLVSDEEFASDVRLEALHNRYHGRHFGASLNGTGGKERARNRWIGLTAAEVDNAWLTDEFKAVEISSAGFARASVAGFDSSLDTYRHIGQRYAALIRKHMVESLARDHRLKNYNDIVREEPIPSGGTFGFLLPAPDISRKLKPMRSTVTRPQAPPRGRYNVVINIQSATNIPERTSGEPTNVFIEVGFQKQYVTTSAVQGSQANWQETLTMELAVQGDDHQVELKSILDHFEFNVYDVEVLELEHDDREPNTVHEQYERRWLGSVEIPFSTIYSLGKIDGSLPVTPPYFCTGYKFSERFTFLKLLITTNPPLVAPGFSSYDNFPANEPSEILNSCQQWEKRCKSRFPDRRYLALANDANGKRVLACRFLRGIQPPPHVSRLSADPLKAVELAAHVASCIPFVADPVMFPGVCDLWTTADQMITIGCGDGEEHAILLVCWLLSIGVTAALLLGTALPEGPKAAYVLVQFDENVSWLVNPSDGKHYATNDPTCPLMSVGTVITSANIYGNVQPATHPSLLHFDLRKKAHWDPLFSEQRTDLISVQIENIGYTDVSEDILLELRSSLEREIRLRFDEVRPYAVPQWNLLASRALREVLNEAEDSGEDHVDVESRLERLRLAYKIRAVAFRKPYVSKTKLVEDVLRTTVHVNSDQNAQFALAVHIQPFVNNIVSCSVALASLTPNA